MKKNHMMTPTNPELKQVDQKFAEMINDIYEIYRLGVKCGIQINLSGNTSDFNYKYQNIDPDGINKIVNAKQKCLNR
jgi:hypothetical protein